MTPSPYCSSSTCSILMMKSSNEGSQLLKFHGRTWKSFEWKPLLNWECLKLNLNRIQFEHECLLLWLYCKTQNEWSQALRFRLRTLKTGEWKPLWAGKWWKRTALIVIWLFIHICYDEWSHHSLKWVSTHWSGTSDVLEIDRCIKIECQMLPSRSWWVTKY